MLIFTKCLARSLTYNVFYKCLFNEISSLCLSLPVDHLLREHEQAVGFGDCSLPVVCGTHLMPQEI